MYFHKVKPSKGVDVTNISALSDDLHKQVETRFGKRIDQLLGQVLNATDIQTRTEALCRMRKYIKRVMNYKWYYEPFTAVLTNEEITKKVESLKQCVYPHEDVYFRKANFVYRYFQPYLENEECIVTKDMVTELIDRCNKVLATVNTEKMFRKNGTLVRDFFFKFRYGEDYTNITIGRKTEEEKRIEEFRKECGLRTQEFKDTAEDLLPTQSGFFFGSTDYDEWYVYDVMSCKHQFEKLLKNWKDDEVVYNIMSW